MKMSLEEISFALKSSGNLCGSERTMLTSVQTDSRLVKAGDLFICLRGQKMDGHNFARQAAENGAQAIVSHQPMPGFSIPMLLVEDTLKALGRLGGYWRKKKGKRVIAITGSAGKTTTKEMLAEVLSLGLVVGKNYKNWNNQIGLPLSILKFSGAEDFWILELGINKPGDMDELGEIVRPDQAVILNIGPCHLQGLGSIEGVAKSKGKILDYLQGPKTAFLCSDYPLLAHEVNSRPLVRPIWFSCTGVQAHYNMEFLKSGHYRVRDGSLSITFDAVPGGEQYCENMAAVWAVARHSGLDPQLIIQGLGKFSPPEQRFSVQNFGPWIIIDDTYNANPLSMTRAINSARILAGRKNLLLVLGDMKELGHAEINAHQDLGRAISKAGSKGVFFNGENSEYVRSGLDNEARKYFHEIKNRDHFKSLLDSIDCPGGVFLFKGSRSLGMEKYIACFKEWVSENRTQNQ
jgi:UDP-N-acetylmuramoyl-tripeptide--D-alanyl-D-alanine ligase